VAINPLNLPAAPQINNSVDPSVWASLGNLGNVYRDAQTQAARQKALASLGTDPQANIRTLLTSNDPQLVQVGLNLQEKGIDRTREDSHWQKNYEILREAADRAKAKDEKSDTDEAAAAKTIARLFPSAAGSVPGSPAFPAPLPGASPQTTVPLSMLPQQPGMPPQAPQAMPPQAPQLPLPSMPPAVPPMRPPVIAGLDLPPPMPPPAPAPAPPAAPQAALPSLTGQYGAAPPALVDAPDTVKKAVASLTSGAPGVSGDDLGELYRNSATRDLAKAIILKKTDPGSWSYQNIGGKVVAMNSNDPSKNFVAYSSPTYEIKDIKTPGKPDRLVRVAKEGQEGVIDLGDGPQGVGGGVDPTTLTGEDYLKTLEPKRAGIVRGVLDYSVDPNKLTQQGGYRTGILEDAKQARSDYDQKRYPVIAAAEKEFATGGPNTPSGSILAGGTTIGHLKHLSDVSQKLGGPTGFGPLTSPINKMRAGYMGQSDNPDLNEYNGILGRVAEEGTKFYRGIGGNKSDIDRDIAAMPPGMSQQARDRGIATQASAMYSKLVALQDRWKNSLGPEAWDRISRSQGFPVVSRKNLEAVNVILKRGGLDPIPVPPTMETPKSGLGEASDKILEDARLALHTPGVQRADVVKILKDHKIPESALTEE
jgi:hypothetical protein